MKSCQGQGIPIVTGEGLEAVEIESVRLEELDARAAYCRRELLGDGVHRVPQARQTQAVVRVHPARRSIVLHAPTASDLSDRRPFKYKEEE